RHLRKKRPQRHRPYRRVSKHSEVSRQRFAQWLVRLARNGMALLLYNRRQTRLRRPVFHHQVKRHHDHEQEHRRKPKPPPPPQVRKEPQIGHREGCEQCPRKTADHVIRRPPRHH